MPTKKGIAKAIKLLQAFQAIDEHMSVSCALTVLLADGKETQKDLEKSLGLSNAASSRNVAYWAKHFKAGVDGQDFIETRENPEDRRFKLVSLRPKGVAFYEKVEAIMEGD